jgi:hypothetical protein
MLSCKVAVVSRKLISFSILTLIETSILILSTLLVSIMCLSCIVEANKVIIPQDGFSTKVLVKPLAENYFNLSKKNPSSHLSQFLFAAYSIDNQFLE